MLRGAAILLAGMAALCVVPAASIAANGVQLTIEASNGSATHHVSLADVQGQADIPVTNDWTSHPTGGAPAETVAEGGTSASAFVRLIAQIALASLVDTGPAMTVTDGQGATTTLSADEVKNAIVGDPHGDKRALFDTYTGSTVRFFKPLTSAGGFTYLINPSGDLVVDIRTTGRLLNVNLDASPAPFKSGDIVHFSATVDADISGAAYEWDFGDGSAVDRTSSLNNSHVYADDGRYSAQLTITTKDGSSGTANVPIVVGTGGSGGTPPNAPPPPPGGPNDGGGGGGGGGAPQTGGGNGGPKAPATGHARGGKKNTSTTSKRKTSTGKRSSTKPSRKKATPAAQAGTTPPPPPPPPLAGTQPTSGARKPSTGAADRNRDVKTPPPAASGPGVPITGILLSGTSPFHSALPALKPARADELARTAARAAAGSPGGVAGGIGLGALAIAVLVSGGARETRAVARRVRKPVSTAAA